MRSRLDVVLLLAFAAPALVHLRATDSSSRFPPVPSRRTPAPAAPIATAPGPAGEAADGRYRPLGGDVVDDETGEPVEGVELVLVEALDFSGSGSEDWEFLSEIDRARTGPDGRFRLERFPRALFGTPVLRISAPGRGTIAYFLPVEKRRAAGGIRLAIPRSAPESPPRRKGIGYDGPAWLERL